MVIAVKSHTLEQIGFLGPILISAKKYVKATILFVRGDKRLVLINPSVTKPGYYLAASIVLVSALIQVVWPDDPISLFELPEPLGRVEPILGLVPPAILLFLLGYSLVTSLPLAGFSAFMGKRLRWHRIVSAACYSSAFALLGSVVLGIGYLLLLGLLGLDYVSRGSVGAGVANVLLIAFYVLLGIRTFFFFGVAFRVHGFKLFVFNSAFIALPILILDLYVSGLHPVDTYQRHLSFPPFGSHYLPSESMEPTLPKGSLILTNYLVSPSSIKVGDVITFDREGSVWVSRVLAVPGDDIQFVDGVPILNGISLDRRPDGKHSIEYLGEVSAFRESLSDERYFRILDYRQMQSDNAPSYLVKANEFYVVGDNRDNALDSRVDYLGPVDWEAYLAKVYFVLFPFDIGSVYSEK